MRKTWFALVAIAAVVLGVGVAAYASIPDANGVIHGCRKNSDGQLRVIDSDAGQTCANGWTPLNWSQTGPQGPAGLAGVHVVSVVVSSPAEVLCPSGETALGVAFSQESWSAAPVFGVDGVTPVGYDVGGAAGTSSVYLTCAVTG